ncbi:MAG: class I SAM-dependent methyltransferase [Flavobacteriales bacterium]|nr:class I SAM-dependent methyltransferase [Flavobacteriales bacterium]
MMDPKEAYDSWSAQYDKDHNRTRDMEAQVLRSTLAPLTFHRVLEIGCGTGKNTAWLVGSAQHITAIDLSEGMLDVARDKIRSARVCFRQADVLQPWDFVEGTYDLITFCLTLEHIEHLAPVLLAAATVLDARGHLYIGELHPFKQYSGSKARFVTENGTQVVRCHDHHVSDFLSAASAAGLELISLGEHFDNDDRETTPRILSLLFRKR